MFDAMDCVMFTKLAKSKQVNDTEEMVVSAARTQALINQKIMSDARIKQVVIATRWCKEPNVHDLSQLIELHFWFKLSLPAIPH